MGKSKELATYKDQGIETSKPIKVGKDGITNAYGDANGYVADFQADTGNQTYISIAEPNASSTGDNGLILGEDTSGSYLYQRASKSLNFGNNNLTRISIDASGRVTKPYQPAFYATFNGYSNTANSYITTYNTPQMNVGNHFNASTGIFTAPLAGTYFFGAAIMGGNTASYTQFQFQKNNSNYGSYHHSASDTGSSYRHTSGTVIMGMNANDTCRLYYPVNRPYSSGQYTPWSSFCGYLLG